VSIQLIRATVDCDGCGTQFHTEMDNADDLPDGWSLFDLATDYVRGGVCVEGGLCSVQADMHLCPTCTTAVDGIGDENHRPTRAEIVTALDVMAARAAHR